MEKGWIMIRLSICALPALLFLVPALAAPPEGSSSGYKVVNKFQIGGEGGWDYLTLDPEARRLYIARSNRVTVLDVETGKVVGEVPKTPGVHGVALVPKRKKGFASNGSENTVTIFDLETLKETGRPKVGNRPDAIIYDPASDRVFTFNAGSKDATALDADTGTVAGTVPLGGKPEFAVADEKGMVFVNIEDKHEVVAFDSRALQVKSHWPLAPGKEPAGLAMDRAKHRLFSTCHNEKMVILDAETGKVLATPAIGKGTDACAFDPGTGLAFSSNRDGTLTVVQEKPADHYEVQANVRTLVGARTMALDPRTHNIYLATAGFKAAAPGERRPGIEPNSFVILVVGTGAKEAERPKGEQRP
jgi:DNA-binding beta-propeller fold protein YncE